MMKKLLFVLFLWGSFITVNAQTERGKFIFSADSKIGTTFGTYQYYYNGQSTGDKTKTVFFNLNPSVGYFLFNNMAMGLSAAMYTSSSTQGSSTYSDNTILIGPFGRLYFSSNKVKPFLGANLSYLSSKSKNPGGNTSYSGVAWGVNGGLAFFVTEHISADAMASYLGSSDHDNDNTKYVEKQNQFSVALGFTLYF